MSRWLEGKSNKETSGYNSVVCVRITPDDYCRLAVSVRKLVRCDDKAAGLRGLEDLETGERFLIEEAELLEYRVTRACDGVA